MSKTYRIVPQFLLCGLAWMIAVPANAQDLKAAAQGKAAAQTGLEIKKLEDVASDPAKTADPEKAIKHEKVAEELLKKPEPAVAPAPASSGRTIKIDKVSFTGDLQHASKAGIPARLRAGLEGKDHARRDISRLLSEANKQLIDQGYYASRIIPTYPTAGATELKVKIDIGRVGKINFYQKPIEVERGATFDVEQRDPYAERWFSTKQLSNTVGKNLQAGQPFNYGDLRSSVLRLNSQPDLTLDADLKLRADEATRQRMIDVDFFVEDDTTWHGVLELNNTGTEETEDLRLFATVQNLNITKNDDMLTLTVPVSFPDLSVLHSFSLGYNLPYVAGNGGAISAFGGYSRLDVEQIQDELGLESDGAFGGARAFYRLLDTRKRTVTISGGSVYRSVSDAFVFGNASPEDRKVEVAPISLGFAYTEKEPTFAGGRSFASTLSIYNAGDALGISEEADMQVQRLGTEADYFIQKFQFARIQPLFGVYDEDEKAMKRQWYAFGRLDLQYSDNSLIPSEQMAAGGMESVRGYPERDVSGDLGAIASVELRSPVYSGALTRINPGARIGGSDIDDKIQFITFVDGGYVERNEQFAEIEEQDFSLLSIGLGLRYSFTQYSQVRLDYGYPLEDTDTQAFKKDVDGTGRLHFSLQAQF